MNFDMVASKNFARFVYSGGPEGSDELEAAFRARSLRRKARRPFDACYHATCDTIENVDRKLLSQVASAARAVATRLADADLP